LASFYNKSTGTGHLMPRQESVLFSFENSSNCRSTDGTSFRTCDRTERQSSSVMEIQNGSIKSRTESHFHALSFDDDGFSQMRSLPDTQPSFKVTQKLDFVEDISAMPSEASLDYFKSLELSPHSQFQEICFSHDSSKKKEYLCNLAQMPESEKLDEFFDSFEGLSLNDLHHLNDVETVKQPADVDVGIEKLLYDQESLCSERKHISNLSGCTGDVTDELDLITKGSFSKNTIPTQKNDASDMAELESFFNNMTAEEVQQNNVIKPDTAITDIPDCGTSNLHEKRAESPGRGRYQSDSLFDTFSLSYLHPGDVDVGFEALFDDCSFDGDDNDRKLAVTVAADKKTMISDKKLDNNQDSQKNLFHKSPHEQTQTHLFNVNNPCSRTLDNHESIQLVSIKQTEVSHVDDSGCEKAHERNSYSNCDEAENSVFTSQNEEDGSIDLFDELILSENHQIRHCLHVPIVVCDTPVAGLNNCLRKSMINFLLSPDIVTQEAVEANKPFPSNSTPITNCDSHTDTSISLLDKCVVLDREDLSHINVEKSSSFCDMNISAAIHSKKTRTRRVQFDKRLQRVSSCHLMDIKMRMTKSPCKLGVKSVGKTCLKSGSKFDAGSDIFLCDKLDCIDTENCTADKNNSGKLLNDSCPTGDHHSRDMFESFTSNTSLGRSDEMKTSVNQSDIGNSNTKLSFPAFDKGHSENDIEIDCTDYLNSSGDLFATQADGSLNDFEVLGWVKCSSPENIWTDVLEDSPSIIVDSPTDTSANPGISLMNGLQKSHGLLLCKKLRF